MKRITVLLALATLVFSGCILDTYADCRDLCARYQECFDRGADIDSCTTRCESRVESGESDRADACDACLDGQDTCTTAALVCSTDCLPLLAP